MLRRQRSQSLLQHAWATNMPCLQSVGPLLLRDTNIQQNQRRLTYSTDSSMTRYSRLKYSLVNSAALSNATTYCRRYHASANFCSQASYDISDDEDIKHYSAITPKNVTRSKIAKLRKEVLVKELKSFNLPTGGNKPVLVDRLLSFLQNQSTEKLQDVEGHPVDPNRTYFLYVKGLPNASADCTGIGIILKDGHDDDLEWHAQQFLPRSRSRFEADYTAILLGLRYACRRGARHLHLYVDNDVIHKHLVGEFKVRRATLAHMHRSIIELRESPLESLEVYHVEKEEAENVAAHDLALNALATMKSLSIAEINGYDPMCKAVSKKTAGQDEESTESVDDGDDSDDAPAVANTDATAISDSGTSDNVPAGPISTTTHVNNNPETIPYATADEHKSHESNFIVRDYYPIPDIDPSKTYLLQFDGGARGNPSGIAGCGVVIYELESHNNESVDKSSSGISNDTGSESKGREIWCGWQFLGTGMSNNAAEYSSLLLGLSCARALGITKIKVEGDSNLIVQHISGRYRVRESSLKVLYTQVIQSLSKFEQYTVSFIRRQYNSRADWLANHAMDHKYSYELKHLLQNIKNNE